MTTSTKIDSPTLTPSQHPIWVGQQLDPDSPLYNMAFTFVFEGAIDPDRFRLAWRRIVDVLKTVELGPELLEKRMTY